MVLFQQRYVMRHRLRTFWSKGTARGQLLLSAHPSGFAIKCARIRVTAVSLGAAGHVHWSRQTTVDPKQLFEWGRIDPSVQPSTPTRPAVSPSWMRGLQALGEEQHHLLELSLPVPEDRGLRQQPRPRSLRIRWEFDPQDWQPERPWGTWSRESGEISVFRRTYTRPYVALRTFVGIEPIWYLGLAFLGSGLYFAPIQNR